ncbi:MAG: cytidylyltransferase domain-containing protein [Thermoleophilaceae bacterium]
MSRTGASVAVVVQARMSSSRLPGKVLEELGPGPTLELLARRLARLREVDSIAIATSLEQSDDPVAGLAADLGLPVVRGPLADVLERYRLAAAELDCDAVVRITADCPLSEPEVIDRLVVMWRASDTLDYVWNTREPRSFPDGLDAEVVSRAALDRAAAETAEPYDREHVTPFVRDRPDRFEQRSLRLEPAVRTLKLSLDTTADLAAIRSFLERAGPDPDLGAILAALGGAGARMVAE